MKKIESIRGNLIVSCQALPDEPLHSSFIMGRMAVAAQERWCRWYPCKIPIMTLWK